MALTNESDINSTYYPEKLELSSKFLILYNSNLYALEAGYAVININVSEKYIHVCADKS